MSALPRELLHVPLLLEERDAFAFAANAADAHLMVRDLGEKARAAGISASGEDDFWHPWYAEVRPYKVKNGVLSIPVKGSLLNDFPYQLFGYATGYQYIREAVKRGLADPDVSVIALLVNSGGGMVSGCFDLCDFIYASRAQKPIRAYALDSAYSAAYAIASSGESVHVGQSGGVGSIGVIATLMEVSRALDKEGFTPTLVRSKPTKAEGHPYEPLSEAARERIQADVDDTHRQFVALVARNRGLTEAVVDGTNALCFRAEKAIEIGLADGLATLDDVQPAASSATTKTEGSMAITQEEMDAAVTAARAEGLAEGHAAGKTDGFKEGFEAANVRFKSILEADVAKERPAAALNFALTGEISADVAVSLLGKLPVEAKGTVESKPKDDGKRNFRRDMEQSGNPNITGEAEADDATERQKRLSNLRRTQLAGFRAVGE